MPSMKYEAAAITTVASTELNSLANGSGASGVEYDNATNQYLYGDFELVLATGSNMTANNTVDLYLIQKADGTNAASTTGPPPNAFVGSFVCQAATSLRVVLRNVILPPTKFTVYVVNNSGVALSASGSTLKLVPYRIQSV